MTLHVDVEQGRLRGHSNKGTLEFHDIPYAADGGRFRDPLPPKTWSGDRDATKRGPIFPQVPSRLAFVQGPVSAGFEQSEDAFRLNVFSPALDGHLPVIFWIHGGGFLNGAGSLMCYSGTDIAKSGKAIVVTVNYRLGVFGNLYLPGISKGDASVRDLLMALTWTHRNINAFGGDPASIVVMGQSAGAWYTRLLMGMEASTSMIHGAILLSCPEVEPASFEAAHSVAKKFCGFANASASGQELSEMPVDALLAAQRALLISEHPFAVITIPFWPLGGGDIPSDCTEAAKRFAGKPVMVGWTREEATSWFAIDPEVLNASQERVETRFREIVGEEGAASCYQQVLNRRPQGTPYKAVVDLVSAQFFKWPSLRLANTLSHLGSPVFTYQFEHQSKMPHVGACHCIEIPFFLGNSEDNPDTPMIRGIDQAELNSLSEIVQAYLLNFMQKGDPNGPGLPVWSRYEVGSSRSMHLGEVISCYDDGIGDGRVV